MNAKTKTYTLTTINGIAAGTTVTLPHGQRVVTTSQCRDGQDGPEVLIELINQDTGEAAGRAIWCPVNRIGHKFGSKSLADRELDVAQDIVTVAESILRSYDDPHMAFQCAMVVAQRADDPQDAQLDWPEIWNSVALRVPLLREPIRKGTMGPFTF